MAYGTLGYGSQAYGAWEYGTRRPVLLSSGPTSITLTASAGINRLLALSSNQSIETTAQPVTLVLVRKLDGEVAISTSSSVDLDVLLRLGGVAQIAVATVGAIQRVIDMASDPAVAQVNLYGALRKEWDDLVYPPGEWAVGDYASGPWVPVSYDETPWGVVRYTDTGWSLVDHGHDNWRPYDHHSQGQTGLDILDN